ncbi:hypothetical protein AWC15_21475 [Mycobacterium lacus]|uniref:Uncharacterized protein n=1 Tax=Mycobacterium lacus TaxID=169765 RepID=A0A1X1Y6I6_9MYCO|nr:hypothetical protein [Mycobacterium lacus]ORW06688.1 hypothetical protein AWC15_21475 [Mycobacterium lacus]BBX96400.1 hypothetical protein MLAC_16940 [Mycobacterium lacus]
MKGAPRDEDFSDGGRRGDNDVGGGDAGGRLQHPSEVIVLVFTEGKAFVELQFHGPPDSPVPPDFVTDVGQKQDTAIKKALTS